MTRVIATTVAALFLLTSSGFAQATRLSTDRSATQPAGQRDFSAKAAGIDTMAAAHARATVKKDSRTEGAIQSNGKRSFWKTPWPYVIAGVVVAGAIIIASNSGGSGSGY